MLKVDEVALRATVSLSTGNAFATAFVLVRYPVAALIIDLPISLGVVLVDEEGLEEPNPLEAILVSSSAHTAVMRRERVRRRGISKIQRYESNGPRVNEGRS